jgi:hypothetical protein
MHLSDQQRTSVSDRTGYNHPNPWSTFVLYSLILSGIFHPFFVTRRFLLLCSQQPPPNTMTTLMKPLHIYTSCKFRTIFNIILPLYAWLFQNFSLLCRNFYQSAIKAYVFTAFPTHAACSANSSLLYFILVLVFGEDDIVVLHVLSFEQPLVISYHLVPPYR